MTPFSDLPRQVEGRRGLADTALVVEQRYALCHGPPPRDHKPSWTASEGHSVPGDYRQTRSADQGQSRTSTQNIVVDGLPARPIDVLERSCDGAKTPIQIGVLCLDRCYSAVTRSERRGGVAGVRSPSRRCRWGANAARGRKAELQAKRAVGWC